MTTHIAQLLRSTISIAIFVIQSYERAFLPIGVMRDMCCGGNREDLCDRHGMNRWHRTLYVVMIRSELKHLSNAYLFLACAVSSKAALVSYPRQKPAWRASPTDVSAVHGHLMLCLSPRHVKAAILKGRKGRWNIDNVFYGTGAAVMGVDRQQRRDILQCTWVGGRKDSRGECDLILSPHMVLAQHCRVPDHEVKFFSGLAINTYCEGSAQAIVCAD